MITTEDWIRHKLNQIRAKRREMWIHAGGRGLKVHAQGERIMYLPDGTPVKVTTSDCNHTSQVEEDEALHAIARPDTIVVKQTIVVPPSYPPPRSRRIFR
jgi:hypothetical protein